MSSGEKTPAISSNGIFPSGGFPARLTVSVGFIKAGLKGQGRVEWGWFVPGAAASAPGQVAEGSMPSSVRKSLMFE